MAIFELQVKKSLHLIEKFSKLFLWDRTVIIISLDIITVALLQEICLNFCLNAFCNDMNAHLMCHIDQES